MSAWKSNGVMRPCQRLIYNQGSGAKKLANNPYSYTSEIQKHCLWSAGHFDRWGRV